MAGIPRPKIAELHERGAHAALDGAERNRKMGGHFAVGHVVKVGELDDLTLVGGQLKQERFDQTLVGPAGLIDGGDRAEDVDHVVEVDLTLRIAALLDAQTVDGGVTGDGGKPGRDATASAVPRMGLIPDFEECILRDFFGEGGVLQDMIRNTVDEAAEAVVQLGERCLFATTDTSEQRRLVWRCVGRHA